MSPHQEHFSYLIGSSIHRNSRVPTADDGKSGVKRKWFAGDTTVRGTSLFTLRATLKPPHPVPRTTTLSEVVAAAFLRKLVRYMLLLNFNLVYNKSWFVSDDAQRFG